MAMEVPAKEVPQSDRRSSSRVITVYRPVIIESGDFVGFCLVRNISAGGLKGMVYTSLPEGQPVCVEFHPDLRIQGKVVWCQDGQIGIAFEETVEVKFIITQMSLKYNGTKLNRAPRVTLECDGTAEWAERQLPIKLIDISQAGAKIAGPRVEPGEEVVIRFEDFGPRKAVVRWARGGTMGINFVRLIPFEELATWVMDQQSKQML